MTTHMQTMPHGRGGALPLIGATAFTLLVLGGAALWLTGPSGEATASARPQATRVVPHGATPIGGVAEQLREQQRTTPSMDAGTAPRGGLAEFYAEQFASLPVTGPAIFA